MAKAKQTHGVPAILSLFIPGLGQLVKGEVGKGILYFFGWLFGLAIFIIPGIIVWLHSVYDAYNG